jgi:hypothetical protein
VVFQEKSTVIFILFCCILTVSCSKGKNISVVSVDAKAVPDIHTEDVSMLISDSGITRYRLETKIWDIYSNTGEPYWYFPKKVYVERFDSLFNIEGTIRADTAYYFQKKGIWQLIKNVVVVNLEGNTFETSELFWDERAPANSMDAIYTNKLAKITQINGNVQYGRNGFRTNQTLSDIRFYSFGGEFYANETVDSAQSIPVQADSIQTDSIQQP